MNLKSKKLQSKNYITKLKKKEIEQEIKYITETKNPELAEKISEIRNEGNYSENTDIEVYYSQLQKSNKRLEELKEILKNSEIIIKSNDDTIVELGDIVTVDITGRKDEFTIVGPLEADPFNKKISNESPVGKALIGAKLGNTVTVKTKVIELKYKIVKITAPK